MLPSLESAASTADSGRRGCEAPFRRLSEALGYDAANGLFRGRFFRNASRKRRRIASALVRDPGDVIDWLWSRQKSLR